MKNNKKCKNKYKQILIAVFSVIIICVVVLGAGYMYIRANIYKKTEPLTSEHLQAPVKTKEETIGYTEVEGITNVLLVGVDGIDFDEKYQRSDSMIIATLDSNKEKVKLTSLYRDTLVYIPGYGEEKMNLAFSLGGPELVMETIKYNFDVNIEKYIMINFAGFEAIIDQIGGVEIDVKEYQLHELNKYIGQATGGGDCPVEKAGLQILNGKQALSYARIRKGVGDDYERTERQREVLFKVAEKLQKTDVIKYFSIANKMLDYLRTNIEIMDGLNMAYTISKFSNLETEQLSIPVQELCVDEEVNGNMALRMDRYENALILNNFIFNDTLPDFILNRSTEKNQSIYYEYEGFGE
ncbi:MULTISPECIES: LCP family protein [Clostridia]|uniref:LCP family protein n=2 Tax=Clostridia TaxID=186801 RepID=A0A8I0ACZ2_9CLOT|nr:MULTISPECIES: LCP family protein [Clostridia]MBC5640144.1 LCP family protein [Clostridium lentum]MBC5654362.1 LCP family protein [Blautia lenta]MEE0568226.1 LCP family protein [Clostridium sp.]CDB75391.1 pBP 5 synthesis repressor [Clostridium sp. CAG:265]